MNALEGNPLAVLTFIVAPAVLTNAASIMGMQTATRFARSVDRARALSALLEGKEEVSDPELELRRRQLAYAERRAMLLVRALTAFYLSVGAFAAASLASLLGALFSITEQVVLRHTTLGLALACGVVGVGGLLAGSGLIVWETRQSLAILREEANFARDRLWRPAAASPESAPGAEDAVAVMDAIQHGGPEPRPHR
jgi:hypothetical protein